MGVILTMIVRQEGETIRRCLRAAKSNIDAWSIVDTGSTDNTREIIREELADVPGVLHERPWKNFGHNRTESFELAKGWLEMLMAYPQLDEVLVWGMCDKYSWLQGFGAPRPAACGSTCRRSP